MRVLYKLRYNCGKFLWNRIVEIDYASPDFPDAKYKAFFHPALFLLAQACFFAFFPHFFDSHGQTVSVLGAAFAAAATFKRFQATNCRATRRAWLLVSFSSTIWLLAQLGNVYLEDVLNAPYDISRVSILLFNLFPVPLMFLLSSDWKIEGRKRINFFDASYSLLLSVTFYIITMLAIVRQAGMEDQGMALLVWLIDIENGSLLLVALGRCFSSKEMGEFQFFRYLSISLFAYTALIFWNNHFVAGNPDLGPKDSTLVTLPFMFIWALSNIPTESGERKVNRYVLLVMRGVKARMLTDSLLIASLFLIRIEFLIGAIGVVLATFGSGLRNALSEVRQVATVDNLLMEHSKLRQLADTDPLTGTVNRRGLEKCFELASRQARRSGEAIAILMIDIDHFKLLNDQYGHAAGDQCLVRVAKALSNSLPRENGILARIGGEEFVVLLRDTHELGAATVAERLRNTVECLGIPNSGVALGIVTVSIGFTIALRGMSLDIEGLLKAADNALYLAKRTGRNQVREASVLSH